MSNPPETLDFGEMLQTLFRGWRWIGTTFVVALLVTAAIVSSMPPRYQSTVELRLAGSHAQLLTRYGLHLGAGDVIPLLMGSSTLQSVAISEAHPPVADSGGWKADQVTAVAGGQSNVFIIVRDEDPDLAAATANAVEAAAKQIRRTSLQQELRETLLRLEREHEDLLASLEDLAVNTDLSQTTNDSLEDTLHLLRIESAMNGIIAMEREIARVRVVMTDPPNDWRMVEQASPAHHALRDRTVMKALTAVLIPTILAAIAWLIHDGRTRRR